MMPSKVRPGPGASPGAIVLGADALTIENVLAVAQGAPVCLADDPSFVRRIRAGAAFLERLLDDDGVIYGVTTGYGNSCTVGVPRALVNELPLQLMRFHGCGLGAHLSHEAARAVLATRLASLCRGWSGVRLELLERLVELLNLDVVPLIPEEGSVGASGDLTPLSYVAALLVGEREASLGGATLPAAEVHRRLGLQPLALRPKEALAVMNGTAVMTALACEAYARGEYLGRLATRLTALASVALGGNRYHFDERLFAAKPHPGSQQIAAWLRRDLEVAAASRDPGALQDCYSIRCAPHVIGVLQDSLPWLRSFIETEINSANDNPLIDPEAGRVLHGGHFYGGHIAFAMDALKTCAANVADLLERQLALLVDVKFNHGLPANLSGASGERRAINHGFKAVQIGASAWAAEALKLTMPASVFSRSTECHNQDKVSMGTIAARDCLRVLQLAEQVAAAQTLAATQAVLLRRRAGRLELAQGPASFVDRVMDAFAFLEEDRALEPDLRRLVMMIQKRHLPASD